MVDLSLQPNQPGVSQLDVLVAGVVVIGAVLEVVVVVVVDSSLHPNHPGVSQVLVDVVVVVDDVVVAVVVVVSSRQPHQPGVLQVAVRVRVVEEVELLFDDDVVPSVLLLSYIFQFAQSRQSGVNLHSGTVSYFLMTSLMTDRIL